MRRRMSKAQLETECSYGLLSTKSSAAPAEAWEGWFDLHGWEAAHVCPRKAQKENKTKHRLSTQELPFAIFTHRGSGLYPMRLTSDDPGNELNLARGHGMLPSFLSQLVPHVIADDLWGAALNGGNGPRRGCPWCSG